LIAKLDLCQELKGYAIFNLPLCPVFGILTRPGVTTESYCHLMAAREPMQSCLQAGGNPTRQLMPPAQTRSLPSMHSRGYE